MEKVNLGYSVKNIPFPSERAYKIKLIEQTEAVVKRIRWKATFFNKRNHDENPEEIENYGLKTPNCPSQVKELLQFENDLFQLVKDVKFRRTRSNFQNKMKEDTRNIRNSNKTLTPADKTSNMYRLSKEEYSRLKTNAVSSKYKKASIKIKERIDKGGLKFAKNAGVNNRMEINGTNNCFITLKDHKENFENNPTTRLINPAKNEIGRISKKILDTINANLKSKLEVNQWKNTGTVIDWFKNIENKAAYTFTMFDIKDFYPSIKESLLKEALVFAKRHTTVRKKDMDVVLHARKSLLFSQNDTWIKKDGGLFDVTMGAYDGAEVCELVGTYLLYLIGQKYDKRNIGLYRDDGLAVFKNRSGPQNERIKKVLQKVFKDKGLDIVIQCNMKIVDYLDVTLNLNDAKTKPFRKPDNETNYIHVESDHPPSIIRQLPISVEKRLSSLSSSEEIFNQSKRYYQDSLARSGHTHELTYNPPTVRQRQRKRKIIWFNPPFSKIVETNIGKQFLLLVDKHFPRNHKFRKIFNRNTIKVSYGCMPNMTSVINAHNKKILEELTPLERGTCNCQRRYRGNCPLGGECLSPNVLYEAQLSSTERNYTERVYKGITEPVFKTRLGDHEKDFNNRRYIDATELSKEVWNIKDKGYEYSITWRLVKQCPSYNPVNKRCILCLSEKLDILEYEGRNLLNKRSELVSKCRHMNKFMISKYDVT